MPDDASWTARLVAGPYDGATVGLTVDQRDLPHAVVVTFAMGQDASELVWHSYVLDRAGAEFHYLGEDLVAGEETEGRTHGRPASEDDVVARRFYELLFERHPHLRPMFSADVDAQAHMLRTAITAVLDHRRDPGWLVSHLRPLGARHARWGVTPSMYAAFTDCMLTAMAEHAGPAWTAELEAEWRDTLHDISDLMLDGAPPTA